MRKTGDLFDAQPAAGTVRRRLILGAVIAVTVCAAYAFGRGSRAFEAREPGRAVGKVLYYVDPMHPAYRSDKPGKAPDCGMDLTPVYASDQRAEAATIDSGKIRLTSDQEQAARLETETARSTSTAGGLHTVGRVAADEALTYRVSAGADGWVRQVFSDQTGTRVKKGEALAAFFSKDISAPQQAYIYALESYERLKQATSPPADSLSLAAQQLATAKDNLEFLGMGEAQIDQLGRTRREVFNVNLTAPADGQILERHVAVGQRFAKGELLYRLADLDHVWVLADVYSGDAALLSSVTRAQIRIEGLPPIEARVATALPQFDELGRTGMLRLEVKNPQHSSAPGMLVPGMIVNVDLDLPAPPAITVHADAVIDSGTEQSVYVALGDGQYELRRVETGRQQGDRVEIRGGLKAGDRVVTAGAFLLDSESRMKNPADNMSSSPRPLP
jgi:membrane fusion protein, copper/silver efflux system